METYLVVGLGNPGLLYTNTRHNIGFKVVKALAKSLNSDFKNEKKLKSKLAKAKIDDKEIYMLLPQTYMNLSGEAVKLAKEYYKIDLKNILIVVDDADIDFLEFRLKMDSGPGGHNGLKSIENELKTKNYARLRIGIGRKEDKLKKYVLDKFTSLEMESMNDIIDNSIRFIKLWIEEGVQIAANEANKRLNDKKNEEI